MGTFSAPTKNFWLDALSKNVSYANPAVYVKLHLGDPGAAGTANPAANTVRQPGTFTTAVAGTTANSNVIEWLSVPNTETYSGISLWNHITAGTFLGADDLSTPAAVTTADTFRIPVGNLDLTIGD